MSTVRWDWTSLDDHLPPPELVRTLNVRMPRLQRSVSWIVNIGQSGVFALPTLVLTLGSEILDAIPQVAVIHRYLPTHYWLGYTDLLRDPMSFDGVRTGLFSAAAFVAILGTAAWARFSTKDVLA